MNDRRGRVGSWALNGVRQLFIVIMIVCLAMLVAMPPLRLIAGVGLIVIALIFVALEQSLISLREEERIATEPRARVIDPDNWEQPTPGVVDIEKRLKTLRQVSYSANAGWLRERAAHREMQNVSFACRPYYQRMMLAERSVYVMLHTGHISGVKPKEMMKQVQQLSHHIAVLVEQIQLADRLVGLYPAGSEEADIVAKARERLIRRADHAMQALEGVPARLLQLATATTTRGLTRLRDELSDMNTRLEGKAEAYEEMAHTLTHLEQEQARLRRG